MQKALRSIKAIGYAGLLCASACGPADETQSAAVTLQAATGSLDQRWRLTAVDGNAPSTLRNHFIITLNDGTKWEIAQDYRDVIKDWFASDPLEVACNPWWQTDVFRIRNLARLDHWQNPEEIWGYTYGGIAAIQSFSDPSHAIRVTIENGVASAALSADQTLQLKDVPSDTNDTYYLIAGTTPGWPYALLSLTNTQQYTIVDAKLVAP